MYSWYTAVPILRVSYIPQIPNITIEGTGVQALQGAQTNQFWVNETRKRKGMMRTTKDTGTHRDKQ